MEFKKDIYGEIRFNDMKIAIENADNIDEVASLREILENEFVEKCLECSTMLSQKESLYNL